MFAVRADRNNRVVYRQVKDLDNLFQEGIRQGFLELMRELSKEVKAEILKKNKTGQIYIIRDRAGRRRRHRASAPGQTHANLTGRLRRSVSSKVRGYDRATFGYGITGLEAPVYAKFLEFGTGKMTARPSLANAIKAVDKEKSFNVGIDRMLKGMVRR